MAIPRKNRKANANIRVAAGRAPQQEQGRQEKPEQPKDNGLPSTVDEIMAISDYVEAEALANELSEAVAASFEELKGMSALAGAALLRARELEGAESEEGA